MPFTPYHFGPGAALHAAAPKHVSFLAFCAANVLIDVEPLYYMLTDQYPVHRFFHTYVGATVAWLFAVAVFLLLRRPVTYVLNLFGMKPLALRPAAIGAALAAYSHVAFDSLMHADMRPLAPFSDANPLLGLVPLGVLHWSCVLAGAAGLAVVVLRRIVQTRP